MTTPTISKRLKEKLKQWEILHNRIKSAHSFRHIRTWKDYLLATGMDEGILSYAYPPEQLVADITYPQLKFAMDCLKLRLEMQETELLREQDSAANIILHQTIPHEYPIGNFYSPQTSGNISGDISHRETGEQLSSYEGHHPIADRIIEETIQLVDSPKEQCTLFNFQRRAAKELLVGIQEQNKRAQLLIAGAGLGKTFIIGAVIRRILDSNFIEGKTYSPWPIILVTRAPIVIQTIRVLEEKFGIDTVNECLVINIEQLRSRFGEMFVNEKTNIINGEEVIEFQWRKNVFPAFMLLDECQSVMNEDSTQSRILQAYNNIPTENTWQIYFSATPFTKVSQAKCFAVATKLRSEHCGSLWGEHSKLTNENWVTFARNVASPSDPTAHNEAAVGRLMKEILPYVVDVKGVRPQFKAHNRIEIIEFECEEDRKFYHDAWERWLRDKARIEGDSGGGNTGMAILAAFTKFRQAAELCKAKNFASKAYNQMLEGFAPVIACCFKTTIIRTVSILVKDFGIPRHKISLIWGGKNESKSKVLKKKELRQKLEKHKDFLEGLKEMGATMEDMGLTTSDIAELMDEEAERLNKELAGSDLRLGGQSKKERQKEIDLFQSGKTDVCIFSFKAGGVGLSLHHCDDLSDIKVKRKKDSNWAVIEEIPLVPIKPRRCTLSPTYSAVELVQGLGRCPRLTSLSDTEQTMLFFKDTIEVDVAHSVSIKLRCLKKVVRSRESWETIILEAGTDRPKYKIDVADYEDITDEDNTLLGGGDDEEEEED